MPQAIPAGLTPAHVLLALSDLDAGAPHPFGVPTKYELVHAGRRYAPKAVVGLAHRHLAGAVLPPEQFSGGEAPGQANYVLRQLGFTVVLKGEDVADDEKPARRDWSVTEVALAVADYFDMLRQELYGGKLNKAEHNERLRRHPELTGRTYGAVEYKHQNISAVLLGLGLPYIRGYKPAGNYQGLLARGVEAYLTANPAVLGQVEAAPDLTPPLAPQVTDPKTVFDPDLPEFLPRQDVGKPWLSRRGRRIDFVRRDAENRRLGQLGEEFVVGLEQARLRETAAMTSPGRSSGWHGTWGTVLGSTCCRSTRSTSQSDCSK